MNPIDQNNENQRSDIPQGVSTHTITTPEIAFKGGVNSGLVIMISCLIPFFIIGHHHGWLIGLGIFVLYILALVGAMQLLNKFDHNGPLSLLIFSSATAPIIYAIYLTGFAKEIGYGVLILLGILFVVYFIKSSYQLREYNKKNGTSAPKRSFILLVMALLIITPFILIGMHHGWLIGSLTPVAFVILLSIVLPYSLKDVSEKNTSAKKVLFAITLGLLFTPFLYTLFLFVKIEFIGGFLIALAVISVFMLFNMHKKDLALRKAQLHWPQISLPFPETPKNSSLPELRKMTRANASVGVMTRIISLQFPISYIIDEVEYQQEKFNYMWVAPEEDPEKEFDYDTECLGETFDISYNPNDPNILNYIITDEIIEQLENSLPERKKRILIIFSIMAAVGVALIGIGISFPL